MTNSPPSKDHKIVWADYNDTVRRRWLNGDDPKDIAADIPGCTLERLKVRVCKMKLPRMRPPGPAPKVKLRTIEQTTAHQADAAAHPHRCLCCAEPFLPWDRKKNRICPSCTDDHQALDLKLASGGGGSSQARPRLPEKPDHQ